jgi:hypothetical protein
VLRQDLDHFHATEVRDDDPIQVERVALACAELHNVVRQPLLADVTLERLTASARIADAALSDSDLGALPRLLGVLLVGEGSG